MQEETDLVVQPASLKRLRQGYQMIVMDPDDIVGLQQLGQFVGELFVDPQIAGQIAARKLRQIDAVVKDRPKNPVGETVVILVEVFRSQIKNGVAVLALLDGVGTRRIIDLAAPSQPHTGMLFQRRFEHHFQTTGLNPSLGNRDAVGNYEDARQ